MKKAITAIIAAAAVSAASAQELSISSTVGYESEYIFRGEQLADGIFHGSLDIAYGDFYAGLWTAQPVTKGQENEIDLYAGYSFAATDLITLDFGGTLYYYPEAAPDADETTFELFIGAAFDVVLSPAVYLYYDFDLKAFTIETSAGYSFAVADATSFDLGAYIGYVDEDGEKGSFYAGATADLTYSFNDTTSASIGIRVADVEGPGSWFYWGASFTAGF